ncbi:hypothetical protein [Streptomyces antimicrobicus]|uniref:Uncharacterized protein n=1 Tax=Streptomyces antimicrobicus TaxID=2883108 RepID=A0ABS8B1B6_9ACTN|nr:hypothetical protein [Streptomyces antimicrobicus]MCB5178383.1 hypothetical protein [Streptomyces antimicrobicus]
MTAGLDHRASVEARQIELVARAGSPEAAEGALLSAVRWLALLPAQWRAELHGLADDGLSIALRFSREREVPVARACADARRALDDPALDGWELVACREVGAGGARGDHVRDGGARDDGA